MSDQVGALPYRVARDGTVEVLLITTRDTRRWVIPKGNRMRGLALHEAAAREAFEEAGIAGAIGAEAVGRYRYRKRERDGRVRQREVTVFPLLVTAEFDAWQEQAERTRRWFPLARAAAAAGEVRLAQLLAAWRPTDGEPRVAPAEGRLARLSRRLRRFVRRVLRR